MRRSTLAARHRRAPRRRHRLRLQQIRRLGNGWGKEALIAGRHEELQRALRSSTPRSKPAPPNSSAAPSADSPLSALTPPTEAHLGLPTDRLTNQLKDIS